MKKSNLIAKAQTPDGKEMSFHERDGVYTIRINSIELMSTRHHASEEKIAELACVHLSSKRGARVLIGGLGFGFTLRAALQRLPKDASIVVAEIMPEVIQWNQVPEYGLAAEPLKDPRVQLWESDVTDVINGNPAGFDSIILDIDNGTSALSAEANKHLYQETGLLMAKSALKSGGCLAVWSASDDPKFAKLMGKSGFKVSVEKCKAHASGGSWHTLFIGRVGRD